MKKILLIIGIAICSLQITAQTKTTIAGVNSIAVSGNLIKADSGLINGVYLDTTQANLHRYIKNYVGAQIYTTSDSSLWLRATKVWIKVGSGGGGGSVLPVNSGAITSLPTIGFVPATTNPSTWINNVFYQSQVPLVTLTGGQVLEFRGAGTSPFTLNYSSSRQAATVPLATIVVAGINETFTQPSAPGTVSGTQSVTVTNNTDVSYSNVTTTTDSKSTTATTSFSFLPKRYFGWINTSDTVGIGTFGYDDSKITSLGNEISSSKSKTFNTGSPTGTQIYVYAYYASYGALTQFDFNGFPSIDAMNTVSRQFTNALGYTGTWIIYWNKNGQTLPSSIVTN